MKSRAACVYVIGPKLGLQKIGHSSSPEQRARLFATGNPELLIVWKTERMPREQAFKVELMAHHLLAADRATGEWFNVSAQKAKNAVKRAIAMVMAGEAPPKSAGPKRESLSVLLPASKVAEIDMWRRAQTRIPSKSEAVRALVDIALSAE